MSTNDSDEFDPRFDPAFQRGFEPTGSRFRPRAGDQRTAEALTADRTRIVAPPVSPAAGTAAPPVAQPVDTHASGALLPDDSDGAADAATGSGVNPFLIALGVLSVLLVAGGVWGVQTAREPFLNTNAAANVDYSGLQMLMTFAPMAIALGIATAVGILFVFAVRWRQPRG
jgi:hypothetical protein